MGICIEDGLPVNRNPGTTELDPAVVAREVVIIKSDTVEKLQSDAVTLQESDSNLSKKFFTRFYGS